MMRQPKHWLLAVAVLVAGVGCSTQTPSTSAAAPSEADIEQSVRSGIQADPALRGTDIGVDADNDKNTLTLTGTVYTQSARSRAVDIARSAKPGVTVTDKIDVKPGDVPLDRYTEDMARETRTSARDAGDKLGDTVEDAWLHTKVKTKLAANDTTDAGAINVDVEKNVVTLRGSVKTAAARQEATRVATETEGVRKVNNRLTVKP